MDIISKLKFRYAKTMPDIPHEYVVRNKDLSSDEFSDVADTIAMLGVIEYFGKKPFRYYYPGDGYKYWIIGDILNRTTIDGSELSSHQRLRRGDQAD